MSENLSTQVLVEQVRQGDQGALEELCARYQMRVLVSAITIIDSHSIERIDGIWSVW